MRKTIITRFSEYGLFEHKINLASASRLMITRSRKGFIHKFPLGKTCPPFGWLAILAAVKNAVAESVSGLMSELQKVLTKDVSFFRRSWPGVDTVQRKSCLTWEVESGNGQGVHLTLALRLGIALLEFL